MIIDFLYTRVKTTYGELKRALECEIRKRKGTITSISPDTFSDRLRNMTTSDPKLSRYRVVPLLNKEDKGRGKIVIYWLTDKARKRYALKLPLIKIDSDREIAYQLLFYYLQPDLNRSILSYDTISRYTFKSEEEFHTFLSRIHMSKEDFHVTYEKYDEVNKCKFVRMSDNYWAVEISKREYLDNGRCIYRYLLPGISPRDIFKGEKAGNVFEHLFDPGVTKQPLNVAGIQELFDILEKRD